MLSGLIIAGFLSALGFVLVTAKFSKRILRIMLGYDYIVDTFITIGFMIFMSGTYSGMMMSIISGICISIVLWITKHIMGYEKLVREDGDFVWTRFPGTWTMERVGKYAHGLFISFLFAIGEFVRGWHRS